MDEKVKGRRTSKKLLPLTEKTDDNIAIRSKSDFQKNFKPIFEDMEAWRKESASSQIPIA